MNRALARALVILVSALTMALPAVFAEAPPTEKPPKQQTAGDFEFQCGTLKCRGKTEYCARENFATPLPVRYSCRKLPRPTCGDMADGGTCSGDPATGLFLDIVYP